MPLLYGEGGKAFKRLQEEIVRHSNDHTIFCWSWPPSTNSEETPGWYGCPAPRPITFRETGDFVPTSAVGKDTPLEFQLTNNGLRISLPLLDGLLDLSKLAVLNAKKANHDSRLCLCLQKTLGGGFVRSPFLNRLLNVPPTMG